MGVHNLHLKIDHKVRQCLEEFRQQLGLCNVSCLVKKFVERGRYALEQRYFENAEQASRYELVNDDLAIERVSLHVFLEEVDYRWLKQNHQDLNFFSIAQIVRWIIDLGIALLKQGVAEAKRQWLKMVQAWAKKRRGIRKKMVRVRQLFTFFQTQPQKFGWVSIYNPDFSSLREIFFNTD